jgi:hypothetical protein
MWWGLHLRNWIRDQSVEPLVGGASIGTNKISTAGTSPKVQCQAMMGSLAKIGGGEATIKEYNTFYVSIDFLHSVSEMRNCCNSLEMSPPRTL